MDVIPDKVGLTDDKIGTPVYSSKTLNPFALFR